MILSRGDCLSIRQLAVNGADLIALGVKQGKGVGQILDRLLNLCLMNPEENERERLIGHVLAWIE